MCIGWNARGIVLTTLARSLEILENEFHWAVLLIQEFSRSTPVPEEVAGHKILCEPSSGGQSRRTCVVVHRDYRACVLGTPIFDHHAAAVGMRAPSGGTFWLISAHLDPQRAIHLYQHSLDILEKLFIAAPMGSTIIASIDANDSIALPETEPTSTVGPYTVGFASRKGILLRTLLSEYGVVAANTWTHTASGDATCYYDGKYEPKQIDYMGVGMDLPHRGYSCRVGETMASKSDHKPLILRIFAGRTAPTVSRNLSTPFTNKPIGWKMKSSTYFSDLVDDLLPVGSHRYTAAHRPDPQDPAAHTIYTDGHFRKRSRNIRVTCAWGFVVYSTEAQEVHACCGPVCLCSTNPLYLGATKRTNNTGEVSAMIESLIWILVNFAEQSSSFHFIVDSSYVLNIVTERCQAKHNVMITSIMKYLWDRVRLRHRITIAWVKLHTGVFGNERADALAGMGDQAYPACPHRIAAHPRPCHHLLDPGFITFLCTQAMPTDEIHYHSSSRPRSQIDTDGRLLLQNPIVHYVHPAAAATLTHDRYLLPVVDSDDDEDTSPDAMLFHHEDRHDDSGAAVVSLSRLAVGVAKCARSHGSVPRRGRPRLPAGHPLIVSLKNISISRSAETDASVRHMLGIRLVELKHAVVKEEFELRIAEYQTRGSADRFASVAPRRVHTIIDSAGNHFVRDPDILETVYKFYRDLYGDPDSYNELPAWIWQRFSPSSLSTLPRLDGYLVRKGLNRLASGKTCSKFDMVVAEMLSDLPDELLDLLADVYRYRIMNHHSEDDDELFDQHEATLIAKFFGAVRVKDYRPIAVLSVFLKLYFIILGELCGLRDLPVSKYQFAFRKGYQGHEIVSILRFLVEKSLEFDEPLMVFDGDIHKAYDKVRHTHWLRSHQKRNIPRVITAAWIREVRRGKVGFRLPGLPLSELVPRERSMIQGDPTAPDNFNLFLDDAIEIFVKRCQQYDWGYPIDNDPLTPPQPSKKAKINRERLPILVYADNYWLLANTLEMLGNMVQCWHRVLRGFDCHVVLAECVWATTLRDNVRLRLCVDGHVFHRVPRAEGFKVLGSQVSFDQSAAAAMRRCFANAWTAFQKHRAVLCCRRAPLARRFTLLDRFVKPAALFGAGSLNLTRHQLQQYRGLHRRMLRKIVGVQRPEDMTLADYMHHVNFVVSRYAESFGTVWWDEAALKAVYTWAGHVGRMSIYNPERLVYRALVHRNRQYLLHLERTHGNQCHGHRIHTWRWERALYGFYGSEWVAQTINNDCWLDSFQKWLWWRTHDFNAQKLKHDRGTKRFKIDLTLALSSVVPDLSSSSSTSSETSDSNGS